MRTKGQEAVMKKEDTIRLPFLAEMPPILAGADWHLQDSRPRCRLDKDFRATMLGKVEFVVDTALFTGATVVVSGDIFDQWDASQELTADVISILRQFKNPTRMIVIPGQHDLPHHSIKEGRRSALRTLAEAGVLYVLGNADWCGGECISFPNPGGGKDRHIWTVYGAGWGTEPPEPERPERSILLWHYSFAASTKEKEWMKGEPLAMLRKHPYRLIITGDNHKPFFVERNGRALLNPGSLMRTAADQIDYKPSLCLIKEGLLSRIPIPIKKDVVTREHIEDPQKHDERMSAFVRSLKDVEELELSFPGNMKRFFKENRHIKENVKKLVWQAMEGKDEH